MKYFYKKGISLIETLIALAVLGFIVAIATPSFSNLKENQVTKTAVSNIISSVDKARVNSVSSLNSLAYGVRFEANQIIIFSGTTFSPGAGDNEVIPITPPASITNVNLGGVSGTEGDFYFNRLTGVPSKTGTITVSTSSYSKIVTISPTGSVSSN